MKILAILIIVFLTGCSGYNPPVVKDSLTTETEPVENSFSLDSLPLQLDWENHKIRAKIDT